VVCPTWIEPDLRADDVLLRLDPGMAFGTAEHGTTRGCLRLLSAVLEPGQRLLDVGTGSGILAIAGLLLGAESALGIDGDPYALEAAVENAKRNGVDARLETREAWLGPEELEGLGSFDGVLANLQTRILGPLLPGLARAVAPAGWLIVSGILDDEVEGVTEIGRSLGLPVVGSDEDGRWRSVLFRRPPP
jgi:ribosomal protein L11 methyltransferase